MIRAGRISILTPLCIAAFGVAISLTALAAVPDPPTYMLQWGSSGSAPGQFSYPVGIATDELGNVYIVDQSNHRIQKFDRVGNFIAQWGSFGSGNGQFYFPCGIAVDLSGNVYVADGNNNRIQKFSRDGTYLTQWGSSGTGSGQFSGLAGNPATDAAGNVYVADAHRVQKFTSAGAFVTQWGSLGGGDGQFNAPNSIAVDAAGYVYVVDRLNLRIQKFTPTGAFVTKWSLAGNTSDVAVDALGDVYVVDDLNRVARYGSSGTFEIQWGTAGSGNGQFNLPKSVDVDAAGNVYVADTWSHRVQKFSGWGAAFVQPVPSYLLTIGGPPGGTGDGQFDEPRGVAADAAGNVYVADTWNNRIQKFSPAGVYLAQWGGSGSLMGQFNSPNAVATDPAGYVYVVDSGNHRVQKFNSYGTYVGEWGSNGTGDGQFTGAVGVATDGKGYVYVGDGTLNRIQRFTDTGAYVTQWGTTGTGNGQFDFVYDVAADTAGNVYASDYWNNRIQKFTSTGTYVTQWGTFGELSVPSGLATDLAGNVYVADRGNHRIKKFNSSGVLLAQFTDTPGVPIASGHLFFPVDVYVDIAGSVYVVDLYTRVLKFVTAPAIALVSDVRNDQGRQARLRILRASTDLAGTVTGYAVYRRIDPPPAGAVAASARRAEAPFSTELADWDYVTTIPARGDAEYNVVVPTLADANSSSRNYTTFFVSAVTSNPVLYFDSPIEAGYSVDNLSPQAPAPFTAAYVAGATHLHWGVSTASDFGTFRLYRGSSAGFTPGAGNLVISTSDTGYVDAGAAGSYYKLSAVDLNGNESSYALLAPGQIVDVPGESAVMEFALEEVRPNPVPARDLVVRFTLPTAESARLELLDLTGRRMVERSVRGPGRHVVELGRENLAAGIYFIRLTHGTTTRVRRVVALQ